MKTTLLMERLVELLKNQTTAGHRVSRGLSRQKEKMPFIELFFVGGNHANNSGDVNARVQIECEAVTLSAAHELSEQVLNLLESACGAESAITLDWLGEEDPSESAEVVTITQDAERRSRHTQILNIHYHTN